MPTMDEIQFFIISQGNSLSEIWERARAEVHPPLVWILRHFLLMVSDDFMFHRLVSVVAGLGAVWAAYLLGKAILGKKPAGLTFAAAMAFMPVAVTSSITLRNYSFLMLFVMWAILLLWRWLEKGKLHNLIGFAALILLASASHFSGFLVAAVCGLWAGLLLLTERRFNIFLLLCVAYVPLLLLGAFHVENLSTGYGLYSCYARTRHNRPDNNPADGLFFSVYSGGSRCRLYGRRTTGQGASRRIARVHRFDGTLYSRAGSALAQQPQRVCFGYYAMDYCHSAFGNRNLSPICQ
jgi:hypothetical protein